MKTQTTYYCYILRCKDNSLYTGYTTEIERRVWEHNNSEKGAKYTKIRRPCILVYFEEYNTKSEALKREYYIKKLSKAEKEKLIINCSFDVQDKSLSHKSE